jgi:hypothetical protein
MDNHKLYSINDENFIHPVDNPREGMGVILWLTIAFFLVASFAVGYLARWCGL